MGSCSHDNCICWEHNGTDGNLIGENRWCEDCGALKMYNEDEWMLPAESEAEPQDASGYLCLICDAQFKLDIDGTYICKCGIQLQAIENQIDKQPSTGTATLDYIEDEWGDTLRGLGDKQPCPNTTLKDPESECFNFRYADHTGSPPSCGNCLTRTAMIFSGHPKEWCKKYIAIDKQRCPDCGDTGDSADYGDGSKVVTSIRCPTCTTLGEQPEAKDCPHCLDCKDNQRPEQCEYCKGEGDVKSDVYVNESGGITQEYDMCPRCFGVGKERRRNHPDRHCENCSGSGQVPRQVACPQCDGRGECPVFIEHGTIQLDVCPKCNGTGKVDP